jgi:hypothetical protein
LHLCQEPLALGSCALQLLSLRLELGGVLLQLLVHVLQLSLVAPKPRVRLRERGAGHFRLGEQPLLSGCS